MLQTHPASLPRADVPEEIWDVLNRLAGAAAALAARIARGDIDRDSDVHIGAAVGVNAGGDGQKALDLIADDAFVAALALVGDPLRLGRAGRHPVLGAARRAWRRMRSPSIRSTARRTSTPTSRSARSSACSRRRDAATASFFRPGFDQIAAGYFIYGPQTALVR